MKDNDFVHYDENALDEEWRDQPALFHKYATILADRQNDYNEAKAAFELTEAELSRAVRDTPSRYGLQKTTEALIEATVKVQIEYQQALKAVNKAKHAVDIAKVAVDTIHQRKASLEHEVILWCRDYNAAPRLRGEDNRMARERLEEVQTPRRFQRVRDRLNEE